jgi:two-component system CheB/CheR fusion protein
MRVRSPTPRRPIVVAIGGSAGALPAFRKLFGALPANTGMCFVVLQHLEPTRESSLADLLAERSNMPVRAATHGVELLPNHVYVVPEAQNAEYRAGRLRLRQVRVTPNPPNLIDGFMGSLAQEQRSAAIGIILSGNGRDGVAGMSAIRAAYGQTFCQRPASARSALLPLAAMAAGVVDFVLDLEQIAGQLVRMARDGSHPNPPLVETALSERSDIERLFSVLRAGTGVDFSEYKLPMVLRRIERRMRFGKHRELADYLRTLESDPEEAALLHADLLIGVTSFFRDPAVFVSLQRTVLAPLVEACIDGSALRIWVAGCATGQEAYSVAISLLECFSESLPRKSVQIFATDALESAISVARAGVYPASIEQDVSPQRLQRFFVKHRDGYQVASMVRELCVFARHDLIADPAFSKLDLITCRNVLIYLKPKAQERVLTKFHQVLRPGGTMLLGGSESVNSESPLFERSGGGQTRSYTPRASAGLIATQTGFDSASADLVLGRSGMALPGLGYDVLREADRVLLTRFVSAAILVDADLQVLQFRGQTGSLMGPLSGAASLHVLKLVDEALLPALRYGLAAVQKGKRVYRREGVLVQLQGQARELDLEIIPLRAPKSDAVSCLVVFHDVARGPKLDRAGSGRGTDGRLVKQLREELAMTRQHLQASVLEQESSNESLRATLEELQSTNEELQVTNEELETGKEELQSTNEALALAHGDLQLRNAELKQLIHDQVHLVEAASIAAALFGPDLRLRRVTALGASLLQLTPLDIGRPVSELRLSGLQGCELSELMRGVLSERTERRCDVSLHGVRHYALELRPYRAVDGSVDGVVMTLNDITVQRSAEEALRRAEQRISSLELGDGVIN